MLEMIQEWRERYPLLLPIAVILLLILFVFLIVPAVLNSGESELNIKLVDTKGIVLQNESLIISVNGQKLTGSFNTDFKGLLTVKVPLNSEVKIELDSDDYELQSGGLFKAEGEILQVKLVAKVKPVPQQNISISVQAPANAVLNGKTIYLELSCRNSSVSFPAGEAVLSNETGLFENIVTPLNCGGAIANVTVTGYTAASQSLVNGLNTIRLSAIEPENGQVNVNIFDAATDNRITFSATVSLVNQNENVVIQSVTTTNGQAQFTDVEQGLYYVTISAGADYAQTTPPEKFGLIKNAVKEVVVKLQKSPAAIVRLSVKHNGQWVENARVQVFDQNKQPLLDQLSKKDAENVLSFFAFGRYTIIIDHKDFITKTIELQVQNKDTNLTVNLEKCGTSGVNACGQLQVTVEDEDLVRVPNASVLLYNSETQFLAQLDAVVTDANGVARFSNVTSGMYYLKARKFPSEGVSEEFSVDPSRITEQKMTLVIGRGGFEVKVEDELGNVIPNARVEFQTNFVGECDPGKCVTETDVKGLASYTFKADKHVFAIVKKDGYADFVTQSRQVYPNETRSVTVVLQKAFLGDAPDIAAPIILDTKGVRAKTIKAGQTYVARFIMRLPSDQSWSEAGFFVRAGDEAASESDFISIEEVDAGGKPSVLMGTTFNPFTNQNADFENATLEHAKWTSITWINPSNGVYVMDVTFQIRREAQNGQVVPLYYRGFVTDSTQSYKRTPKDAILGESSQSTERDALYAESLIIPLKVGELLECETDVCLSNEELFDTTEQLFLTSPYTLKVFGTYEYSFAITNRSPLTLPDSQLSIESVNGQKVDDVIRIRSYEVKSPQAAPRNDNLNDFETGLINLGDLNPNESATAHLVLVPQLIKSSGLRVQLRAGNRIVFDEVVNLNVKSDKQLTLTTDPTVIGALFEMDMNLQVKDNEGVEVENAVIKMKVKGTDSVVSYFPDFFTDQAGRVTVPLPAFSPGAIVTIEAQKEDFEGARVEFKVDENVLSFDPESLSSKLNLTAKPQEELITEAQSKIKTILTLTGTRLVGRFYGLLDEDAMSSFLRSGVGTIQFNPDITTDYRIMTRVNNSATLRKSKTVTGSVFMEVKSAQYNNHAWRFNLPLSVRVDVGQAVDTPNCLTIDLKDWTGTTLMGKVAQEFSIANNCTVNGRRISLNQLMAQLKWKSNVFGNVELSISDPETGSLSNQTLRNGEIAYLWDQIRPADQTIYRGIITFVPYSTAIGETAQFEVNLDASVTTNSGETLVGSSNPISASIVIQNLEQCLTFDPDAEEGFRMKAEEDEKAITIDASKCGKFPGGIKLRFCQDKANNTNCKGGTLEGGIELSTYEMTLNENSKDLTVNRLDMPGIYGLTIEAKVGNQQFRRILDYPVIIEPRNVDAFSLDRYTFYTIGANSQDSTTLFNRLLEEDISVKADICIWSETIQLQAEQSGFGDGLMMVGGILTLAGLAIGGILFSNDKFGFDGSGTVGTTNSASKVELDNGERGRYTANEDGQRELTITNGKDKGTTYTELENGDIGVTGPPNEDGQSNGTIIEVGDEDYDNYSDQLDVAEGDAKDQIDGANQKSDVGTTISIALFVVGIALILWSAYQNKDQYEYETICREYYEETLRDFVINLRGGNFNGNQIDADAGDIGLQVLADSMQTKWNLDITNNYNDSGKRIQEVGIVFTNVAGVESPDPIYDVLTIKATEHIHGGNTLHDGSAKVNCEKAGFSNYYIPCDEDTDTRTEQIHVRFKTAPIENRIIPVEFDTVSCAQGALIGRTGAGAIPEVKLNWSWSDQSGIGENTCSPYELDGVYCDATQNSISIAKRLKKLEGFLEKNNYFQGVCPTIQTVAGIDAGDENTFSVPMGKVGISKTVINVTGTKQIEVSAVIDNNSNQDANVTVRFVINQIEQVESADPNVVQNLVCEFPAQVVPNQATVTQNCVKDLPSAGSYYVGYELDVVPSELKSAEVVTPNVVIINQLNTEVSSSDSCPTPRTTDTYLGMPVINFFVRQAQLDGTLQWAPELGISSEADLTNLLHFESKLMRDGYSPDFRGDFVRYYQTNILDAPEWFTKSSGGFNQIWSQQNQIDFTQKYYDAYTLPNPGIYVIDIALTFKDDWSFFDAEGKLKPSGKIMFYLLQSPYENTAFYDLPLNGAVGIDGDGLLNRQDYGTKYVNQQLPIAINQSPDTPQTWNDSGSFALQTAQVTTSQNFEFLNSLASTRGNVLEIRREANEKKIYFTPTFATPILMELSTSDKTTDAVSSFYQLTRNGTPIPDLGGNAFLWSGANNCRDFSGTGVTQVFVDSPDRAGRQEDSITAWQTAYGLDWARVDYPGKVYVRTIAYTTPGNSTTVQSVRSLVDNKFYTADESGSSVTLGGVSTMRYNTSGLSVGSTVKSIEDVFELVREGYVCVTNTGVSTRFWWNPEKIYTTAGQLPSIHDQAEGYATGSMCSIN